MEEIVFKRKIYDKMLDWKKTFDGKSALLIKGARRIGKSTIVEEFAKKEYKSYILIDFSKVNAEVKNLFADISDLEFFFMRLQLIYGETLHTRKSVIIFDEVQLNPLARQAIKHLVKDGRYDYIETGSLLSIKKNIKDIIIPSEEKRITMGPMDYEEFNIALGDEVTIPLLKSAFEKKMPLGEGVHRKLLRNFRLYMLIGGMPQAVLEYINTNNLSRVDEVKRNILELYYDDFRKIDSTGKASIIFESIPAELSKNASRYQISSVIKNGRAERVEGVIADMQDSMTAQIAYHANDPNSGMALSKDISKYKLFLSDTGLFVTLAFKDKEFTENIIYEKLLSDKLSANLGYIFENIVAQMLKASGHELFYYTFPKEDSIHKYEIDFLLSKGDKICPIEVKSSNYKKHNSIDAFERKFSNRMTEKYIVHTKDLKKEGNVTYLPIYMVPFL